MLLLTDFFWHVAFSIKYLKADLEYENHAGFYPQSGEKKP